MTKVSSKNQVTIPVEAMRAAGLQAGDEIQLAPLGANQITVSEANHLMIAKSIPAPLLERALASPDLSEDIFFLLF